MACRSLKRGRKGTFSIEAAIILISFVVIASALAFVVINMGYFAAQKTKDTMEKGVLEASSVLELDGSITAYVNTDAGEPIIQYLIIPVKTCVAKSPVDLSSSSFVVAVTLSDASYTNIYNGTLTPAPDKIDSTTLQNIKINKIGDTAEAGAVSFILPEGGDGDEVLELNEKAYIVIYLQNGPTSYETIKIEFRSGEGATMMLSRQIPPGLPDSGFVDLG